MDLRVLGNLRVDDGDRTVTVPPGKATELLLRLLADAGQPVAVDALVEAMWPASPPRDARAALQVKVSQLRRTLEPELDRPADSSVIVSEGDAYLVPADGLHVIDAHRFSKLVAEARRLVRDDRTGEAVELLGEALGLWAGEVPFVESRALWATEARAELVELRQQAREERAALVLERGGALAPIVSDLERLCAEEPLRERSHELLMWALYRVGRQVEALTVHDALRRRLVDELGIDPSPALQDLQRRILAHDPRLDAPVPPPAPSPLPAPLTGFVDGGGRIERSRQLLGAARLVTLIGFGGTGKTRLALETARRTDGAVVWFADLTTVTRSTDVAEAVATALGATPDTPNLLAPAPDDAEQALARIAARVADRPALLVLDNCEHVLDGAAEVARQVLGDCPGLRVLATSRQALGIPGEAVWSLPPLGVPPPDVVGSDLLGYPAIELLLDRLRLRDPSTAHADAPELLAEIARRLDGIPLALELVAARAGTLSLAAIVRRLDDHLALSTDARGMPERHRTLTAVVDWSWQLLDERQRATASTCGVFLGPFDRDDVLAVHPALQDAATAEEVLFELVDRSLLTVEHTGPDGEPTYSTFVTIREVVRRHLRARGDVERVEHAHLYRCVEVVAELQPRLRGPDRDAALAVLDRRAADLTAALDRAIADDDRTSALSLASGMGWWWLHRRRSEGAARLLEALACEGRADPLLEAEARRWAAFINAAINIHDSSDDVGQGPLSWTEVETLAEAALVGYRELGDDLGSGLTLLILASSARHTGRHGPARAHAADAAVQFDRVGDQWGLAMATINGVDIDLEDPEYRVRHEQARAHAADAAVQFDRLGERWGLAMATIIGVDIDLEDPEYRDDDPALLERIDRAGMLFADLGDGWGMVRTASRRAEWFERSGQPDRAAAERRAARDRADQIGLDLDRV